MADLINATDSLNTGRVKINAIIEDASAAVVAAEGASAIAGEAKTTADSVQTQLDTIILDSGTSDAEVVQSRVDKDGKLYTNLKDRLDSSDAQLADKRDSSVKLTNADLDISSDTAKIKLLNLAEEVQEAMAGTAPVIGSVSDGSLTTLKHADNAIKPIKASFFDNVSNLWQEGNVTITGNTAWKNVTYNFTTISPGIYTVYVDEAIGMEPSIDTYVEITVTNGTTNLKTYNIKKSVSKYAESIIVPEGYYIKVILFLSRETVPSGTISATFRGIYLFLGLYKDLIAPKINSVYLDIPNILAWMADEVPVELMHNEIVTLTATNPGSYSNLLKTFTVEPSTAYFLNVKSIIGSLGSKVLNVELLDSSNTTISMTSYAEINNIEILTTETTTTIKLYFYLTYDSGATGVYTVTFDGVDFYKIGTLSKIYQIGYDSLKQEVKDLLPDPLADRATTIILPKKMYFTKDKQVTLYHENILWKNLNDPSSLFFNKGTNYNRQTAFKFGAGATSQSMTTQIAENLKKGEVKSIAYDVIDATANIGKTTNMLFIGDSFTDIGQYVKETKTLLGNDGVNVNLIGTCGSSTFKAEGLSGGTLNSTFLTASQGVARIVEVTGVTQLPSTGYPGQTYRDTTGKDWLIRGGKIDVNGNGHVVVTKDGAVTSNFSTFPTSGTLTKQTAGEGDSVINYANPIPAYFNPFINPTTGLLDLTNYITYWGFNAPNVVVLQFTWNDTTTWSTDSSLNTLVANFKTAVDHIHSCYPNAKVILSIEPFGSVNGNKDWNGKKYTVLRLVELMLTAFEDDVNYSAWVKIAPSYAFVDLVYGYATGTVTPSERYTVTEQSGGDGVHPSTAGMNQIADCIYPITQHFLTLL